MKKVPVWRLLVERGLFQDRKEAESWIIAGKVIAGNTRIDKPGQQVSMNDEIVIKGINQKYVSKGGLKLEGALSDFHIDVTGIVAIDAGSSTGGFTDCLLQQGALRVYAVDVGYGQLAGKLYVDPRVVPMEKVNISHPKLEALDPKPVLATVDLSYLSLKHAIPILANVVDKQGEMICLVKPLFEVPDSNIRRSGVIDNPDVYREVLKDLAHFVDELGFAVIGITHSHVTGNKGTREFFIRVSLGSSTFENMQLSNPKINVQVENAVNAVMKLELFNKESSSTVTSIGD